MQKGSKILKVVYPMLSCIVGAEHTCHNVFKGWAHIEEINKLFREDTVCLISVKTEIWRITISKFPFILTYPPFFTLHQFSSSPSQYTCSLVETIILYMRFSRIRPVFFREKKCFFLIQFPPGLQLSFLLCVPFALKMH